MCVVHAFNIGESVVPVINHFTLMVFLKSIFKILEWKNNDNLIPKSAVSYGNKLKIHSTKEIDFSLKSCILLMKNKTVLSCYVIEHTS